MCFRFPLRDLTLLDQRPPLASYRIADAAKLSQAIIAEHGHRCPLVMRDGFTCPWRAIVGQPEELQLHIEANLDYDRLFGNLVDVIAMDEQAVQSVDEERLICHACENAFSTYTALATHVKANP